MFLHGVQQAAADVPQLPNIPHGISATGIPFQGTHIPYSLGNPFSSLTMNMV